MVDWIGTMSGQRSSAPWVTSATSTSWYTNPPLKSKCSLPSRAISFVAGTPAFRSTTIPESAPTPKLFEADHRIVVEGPLEFPHADSVWRVLPVGTGRRLRNGRVASSATRVRLPRPPRVTRHNSFRLTWPTRALSYRCFADGVPVSIKPRVMTGALHFPEQQREATAAHLPARLSGRI